MAIKKLDRLSPYNVSHDLMRAELYREIRKGNPEWPVYEIQLDETLRPELAAYRHYGTDILKWVILVAARLDDYRNGIEAGARLRLPPVVWIRERIRHYSGEDA